MQTHGSEGERTEAGNSDGRRDAEPAKLESALGLAITLLSHMADRPMRVNQQTVNLSVRLTGAGRAGV